MRMAIGLAALLIGIGVMVWIMQSSELPAVQKALDVNKKVKPQVEQMAGKDSEGVDARKSISLDSETSGGRMTSVLVTAIDENGAMAKYFGLKKGDSIMEIAPSAGSMMPVKEMSTPAEAKDQLLTAFQNSQQIVVSRDGQKITLPAAPAAKPGAPAAPPANASGSSLQQQLDSIQKIPTR
jgi:hypothetical protein